MTAQTIQSRLEAGSTPVPFCGCRLWVGAGVPRGYGVLSYMGRQRYAHRLAWTVSRGAIPNGLRVLHQCDTPACINVDHLFLGTDRDNVRDMMAKGRAHMRGWPKGDKNHMRINKGLLAGERNGFAKLTGADVAEIRRLYAAGHRQVALATQFCVRQCHISRIVRGESWAA